MNVGFIGLGNVGSKLAGSLLRDGFALTVLDLRPEVLEVFSEWGADVATSLAELTAVSDVVITSLPNPEASAAVLESEDGVLSSIDAGKVWIEMSTTSSSEVIRLGGEVAARGGAALDCPVSGGCHLATTGNISIFAGGDRRTFEACLPVLESMGRRILHTGPLGSASILKVITNYLASANLVAVAEAMVTAQRAGMDLATTFEAIRISSGNSFVHETETQLILNGSRNINFTMDLVVKDMTLFQEMAQDLAIPLDLSPLILSIFEDGLVRYGPREWSTNIIRRHEPGWRVPLRRCDLSDRGTAPGRRRLPLQPVSSAHRPLHGRHRHRCGLTRHQR